jgi:hypothetical protein
VRAVYANIETAGSTDNYSITQPYTAS